MSIGVPPRDILMKKPDGKEAAGTKKSRAQRARLEVLAT
jgi:hypothetical protein